MWRRLRGEDGMKVRGLGVAEAPFSVGGGECYRL